MLLRKLDDALDDDTLLLEELELITLLTLEEAELDTEELWLDEDIELDIIEDELEEIMELIELAEEATLFDTLLMLCEEPAPTELLDPTVPPPLHADRHSDNALNTKMILMFIVRSLETNHDCAQALSFVFF